MGAKGANQSAEANTVKAEPKMVQKKIDGVPQFEADGKTPVMVKYKYTRRPDVLVGVVLGNLNGDTLVNPHGQTIIDELIVLSKEENGEEIVSAEDLKSLRTDAFYARLQAAAPTKQKVGSVVSGWMSTLRLGGFITDKRVPRSSLATRGKNAPVSQRTAPVIRTREEILAARGTK